ncbi:MAG TPA: hypothetical protein VFO85_07570, partial [Vicinamibacteria bacterium]|nr:hypothetical protein [Vicinamibacteria bacterium]
KLFLRGGQGRWKAIRSLDRAGGRVTREEWYDLASDPGEAARRPGGAEVDAVRRRALARWRAARASGTGPAVRLTEEQRERLRALGYVGP